MLCSVFENFTKHYLCFYLTGSIMKLAFYSHFALVNSILFLISGALIVVILFYLTVI